VAAPFPARHRWAAALALGGAGLLVNLLPVALSPGIDLVFGGVAVLLAAVALGPLAGLLAAAVASLPTLWLWGHPYAWAIFCAEAAAVGWLARRGWRPLAAGALYWAAAGVPLIFLTYWTVMGVRGSTAAIIFLKQPLNGLVNAVLVEAILLFPVVRAALGARGRPPLRAAMAVVMALAAILPALVFGIWTGRAEWERNLERTEERLRLAAGAHAARLGQYVLLHGQEIRSIARTAELRGDFDAAALRQMVGASREHFPGLAAVQAADSRGTVVAAHPGAAEDDPLIGADRDGGGYVARLRETRATVVTGVSGGEAPARSPYLVLAEPIVLADTLAGFVAAALDLGAIPAPHPPPARDERVRVADAAGRVVYDSRRPYAPGNAPRSVADSAVFAAVSAARGDAVVSYQPSSAPLEAGRHAARRLAGVAVIEELDWRVWAEQPLAEIQAFVAEAYVRLFGLLIAVTLAALAVSQLLSGMLARPLLRIRGAATALAAGDREARVGRLSAAAPAEVAQLGRDFDAMAGAMARHTAELEELSEIARSLAGTLEPDRVLAQVTEAAARLVHADGCTLALLEEGDEDGAPPSARVVAAAGRAPLAPGEVLPAGGEVLQGPLRGGGEPGWAAAGAHTASAPLRVGEETLGVLAAFREAAPFTADDARLLGAFAGHAAAALRNARLLEEAQAAARARAEFIATMSHELRTPLNAVLGHLQILDMEIHGSLTAEQRGSLRRIDVASRHLRGLIEEVLSFARVEAGRVELRMERVDLCTLTAEVAAVIEPLATQKALEFRLEPCGPHPEVRTDAEKVRQIVINLAGNAVKFTERGAVRLRVCAREDGVAVAVSDTGPGIPAADRDRLFRPFEQLQSGFARPHGGTGLGLYLSGEYARMLGGSIEVESEPGEGSTFTLVLPAEPPEAGE
jgi:signal transduction histidine kinase